MSRLQEFYWHSQDGLKFYACEWQADGKPRAVVGLVHGLGEHCRRYDHVASRLNQAGIGVLAFDHRGHGRTEGKRGHAARYELIMNDVTRLLDEIKQRFPSAPKFLYGHSFGGSVVLNYVLRQRPDLNGVIATSPGLRPAFSPPSLTVLFGRLVYDVMPGLTISNHLPMGGLSQDPEVDRACSEDPLVHDRLSVRLGIDILQKGQWALDHAGEFPLPLLLLHGSSDRLASFPASQEFARRAGEICLWKPWEGGYHELHNEPYKDEVLDFITHWIISQI